MPSALGNWVKRFEADRTKGRTRLTTTEPEELARLRKQVRVLEEEREILEKAAAFFQAPALRFHFIAAEKAVHSVSRVGS